LIAPFLWSLLNHVDKYVITKYAKEGGLGGLIVFSTLFSAVSLPFIFFIDKGIFSPTNLEIFYLIITGMIFATATLFSLYALTEEDASYIVPFWQLAPIFGFILGLIFLGETISEHKILASLLVIFGATILSFEFEENVKFKLRPVLLMVFSSFFIALSDIIFKSHASEVGFWPSIFWNQVGMALFGLICLLLIKNYRKDFVKILKANGNEPRFLTLNIFTEVALIIANIVNYYAMLLAPVSLVLLVNYTTQPLFVFAEGILLTLYFPHILTEKLSKKHLWQKFISIIIMGVGIYFIYQ
ncbi:MAG: EamA family transporter, partial [bacterium]